MGSVIAFGASITEGRASSSNANRRWPNYLARRLSDAGMAVGVLNEGISGNTNAFVLGSSSGCDAVLDQAGAVSDPADRASFLPAFNSGDNLHPNDAGMRAIANALDLDRLR